MKERKCDEEVVKVSLSDSVSDPEPPPGRERAERPEEEKKKKKKRQKKRPEEDRLERVVASSSGQPSLSSAVAEKKMPRPWLSAVAVPHHLLIWPRVGDAWHRRSKGAGGGSSSLAAASSSGNARSTHQHQEAEPRDAAPSERRRPKRERERSAVAEVDELFPRAAELDRLLARRSAARASEEVKGCRSKARPQPAPVNKETNLHQRLGRGKAPYAQEPT